MVEIKLLFVYWRWAYVCTWIYCEFCSLRKLQCKQPYLLCSRIFQKQFSERKLNKFKFIKYIINIICDNIFIKWMRSFGLDKLRLKVSRSLTNFINWISRSLLVTINPIFCIYSSTRVNFLAIQTSCVSKTIHYQFYAHCKILTVYKEIIN